MYSFAEVPQCNTGIGFEFLGKSKPSLFVAIHCSLLFHNYNNKFNGTKIIKRESAYKVESRRRLRISDILKLTWFDIKEGENDIRYVRTQMEKTKEFVTVPLSNEALKWLPVKGTTDLVFENMPQSRNTRNKSIKNWIKTSKIDKHITFHCARHKLQFNQLKTN